MSKQQLYEKAKSEYHFWVKTSSKQAKSKAEKARSEYKKVGGKKKLW